MISGRDQPSFFSFQIERRMFYQPLFLVSTLVSCINPSIFYQFSRRKFQELLRLYRPLRTSAKNRTRREQKFFWSTLTHWNFTNDPLPSSSSFATSLTTLSGHCLTSVEMEPGVIVVHNLPKDFAEKELKDYFVQFGPVTRLRVSRSRKVCVLKQAWFCFSFFSSRLFSFFSSRFQTRGTRGYAYVEFQCKDVAEIAAQSMNNYLMFGRSLKCKLEIINSSSWRSLIQVFLKYLSNR